MRRVDEAMREVLGDAIAKDLHDPRVGFVTVTGVKTSPDLRHARVYVSVLGGEEQRAASLEALQAARGFLQARVAQALRIKHTPALVFDYDESVDRGMRMSRLIDEAAVPQRDSGDEQLG
jgi:ribosome-binding factor A